MKLKSNINTVKALFCWAFFAVGLASAILLCWLANWKYALTAVVVEYLVTTILLLCADLLAYRQVLKRCGVDADKLFEIELNRMYGEE